MQEVAGRLTGAGVDHVAARAIVRSVDEQAASRSRILQLKAVVRDGLPVEQWLLLTAATMSTDRVASGELPKCVVELIYDEFRFMATRDHGQLFDAQRSSFVDLAKKATLRRFPAGQFDWEPSGIPRSYLLRVRPADACRVAWTIAARLGGLHPVFFSHLNPRRPNARLVEREALRSYARMAAAMRLQPRVRGFAACSWFRSPDTHAVSPHLAWLSDVFLANGGIVVRAGAADPDCGVFHRSATRRRLFEAGEFRPTVGLVVWPRAAMLAWADAHRDLLDD